MANYFSVIAVILAVFVLQTQTLQWFRFDNEVQEYTEETKKTTVYFKPCQKKTTETDKEALVPLLFHENDCTKFWKCEDGKAYLQVCLNNKKFDTKTFKCTYPNKATCLASQIG